jgi:hypothetical protein
MKALQSLMIGTAKAGGLMIGMLITAKLVEISRASLNPVEALFILIFIFAIVGFSAQDYEKRRNQ